MNSTTTTAPAPVTGSSERPAHKVYVQRALNATAKPATTSRETDTTPVAKAGVTRPCPPPQPLTATAVSMRAPAHSAPSQPNDAKSPRHVVSREIDGAVPVPARTFIQPQALKSPPLLPNEGLFRHAGPPPPPAKPAPSLTAAQRKIVALALILEYHPTGTEDAASTALCAASPATRTLVESRPSGWAVGQSLARRVMQPGPPDKPQQTLQHILSTNMQKKVPTTTLAPIVWWLERVSRRNKTIVVLNAQQIAGTGTPEGPLCSVAMHANFTRSPTTAFEAKERCPRPVSRWWGSRSAAI